MRAASLSANKTLKLHAVHVAENQANLSYDVLIEGQLGSEIASYKINIPFHNLPFYQTAEVEIELTKNMSMIIIETLDAQGIELHDGCDKVLQFWVLQSIRRTVS